MACWLVEALWFACLPRGTWESNGGLSESARSSENSVNTKRLVFYQADRHLHFFEHAFQKKKKEKKLSRGCKPEAAVGR